MNELTTAENVPAPPAPGREVSVLVIGWRSDAAERTRSRVEGFLRPSQLSTTVVDGHLERTRTFFTLERLATAHANAALAEARIPVVVLAFWRPLRATLAAGSSGTLIGPALAILATPDVLWLVDDLPIDRPPFWPRFHRLDQVHQLLWNPLFDWTGMRESIRGMLFDSEHAPDDDVGKLERVISLDDEQPYRLFAAYAAYRHGFPTLAPESMAEARRLLGGSEQSTERHWSLKMLTGNVHIFEDVYMGFPDQEESETLRDPNARSAELPLIDRARTRTVMTSGTASDEQWTKLRVSEESAPSGQLRQKVIYKPFTGLIDFWRESPAAALGIPSLARRSVAPGSSPASHETSGILGEVARRMLVRAEWLIGADADYSRLLLAAVLSIDANRLLRGQSPTTILEAISIQQRAELRLECQFRGVAADPNIKMRLAELESGVAAACAAYSSAGRERAKLAAQIEILSELIAILRQFGRFEEELECISKSRWLRLKIRQHSHDLPTRLSAIALTYPVFLLTSAVAFTAGIAAVTVTLGWAFLLTSPSLTSPSMSGSESLVRALVTTLSVQPTDMKGASLVDCACILSGLFHFGVFVSHIYNSVIRR